MSVESKDGVNYGEIGHGYRFANVLGTGIFWLLTSAGKPLRVTGNGDGGDPQAAGFRIGHAFGTIANRHRRAVEAGRA